MDQIRGQHRAERERPANHGGRHRAAASPAVRVRRVAAALVVALAAGSSAVGAARGNDDPLTVAGTLVGEPLPKPAATSDAPGKSTHAAKPAPTPTSTPSTTAPRPTATSPKPQSTSTAAKAVPSKGNGKREPVRVPGKDSTGAGRVVTYAFEVEGGLGIDRAGAARIVGSALRDGRGWQKVDGVRFVQLTSAQRAKGTKPKVTISLVSPKMTDAMCAPLSTAGTWSCANKDHAVLNYRRWALGTPTYASIPLADYRRYVVNHEVGHELGHPHVKCAGKGKRAAVMMQQSKGLSGCKTNVWPSTTRG